MARITGFGNTMAIEPRQQQQQPEFIYDAEEIGKKAYVKIVEQPVEKIRFR